MGYTALTFLPSALCPSFPDGGSVDTVKSFGSSQSRIFDSFINESSFFLAMFSTRFRLVATCQSETATPCHHLSPAAAAVTAPRSLLEGLAGAGEPEPHLGFWPSPQPHTCSYTTLLIRTPPRRRATRQTCHLPGALDRDQQARNEDLSDSNTCMLNAARGSSADSFPGIRRVVLAGGGQCSRWEP